MKSYYLWPSASGAANREFAVPKETESVAVPIEPLHGHFSDSLLSRRPCLQLKALYELLYGDVRLTRGDACEYTVYSSHSMQSHTASSVLRTTFEASLACREFSDALLSRRPFACSFFSTETLFVSLSLSFFMYTAIFFL